MMTQPALAEAAGLSLSTVVDFERERRPVSSRANDKLRSALERHGVTFIEKNGGGDGVRFSSGES